MKKGLFLLLLIVLYGIAYAQQYTVTGKVTSTDDGSSLPGVSISVKGTTTGTITNIDGNYSLIVPDGDITLVFAFVGLKSKEIELDGRNQINVALESDIFDVDEVVVVGYGVQKKSVVTGSIAKVSSDDFEKASNTRVENALQGRTAGVIITQNSGQPGDAASVLIRGIGSINNTEPLWVVDGMPIHEDGIDFLDPSDIESIEVLKDAASAAIYGTRAANGVIIITTKSGKSGKSKLTYDASYGLQNPWKKRDVLNASEYAMIMNEIAVNDESKTLPYDEDYKSYGEGTDWQDAVFNLNAPVQSHNVAIQGGSEMVTYYSSFNYFSQEGIVGAGKSNYDRMSIRLKTEMKVFEEDRPIFNSLKVGINATYADIKSKGIDTNSEWGSPLGSALMISPIEPVYQTDPEIIGDTKIYKPNYVVDAEGNVFNIVGKQEITNPVASLYLRNQQSWSRKVVSNFYAELGVAKNLTFRSSFNAEVAFWGGRSYSPVNYLNPTNKRDVNSVSKNTSEGLTWLLENYLRYDNSFGDHNLSVLAGQSSQYNYGESLGGTNYNLPEEMWDKAYIDYATGTIEEQEVYGGVWEGTLASYFGRVNYDFGEKYLFTGIIRRDGSSKFGPKNKWGIFPSASVGWVATNEDFLDVSGDMLSFLKIRASWGLNGNERSLSDFQYTTTLNGGNNYTFGNGSNEGIVNGVKPSGLTNPDLHWEVAEQTDFGIDTRFLNNRLSFTADYFIKKTKGMLIQMPVPALVGDAAPTGNVGTLENRGVELELGYNKSVGEFNFGISANVSFLKNKIENIGNEDGILYHDYYAVAGAITRSENGMPYRFIYGMKTDGIFQTQEEVDEYTTTYEVSGGRISPGDVRWVDNNGDMMINDDDKTMLGNSTPDFIYGATLTADWKGIDLSLFIQGVAGNEIYDATRRPEISSSNYSSYILDRWNGEGTSDRIPRITARDFNKNNRVSDLHVYKGDYLRVKDLQVGYTIPASITKKIGISRCRIYYSGHNLLTITDYFGFDPEIGAGNGVDKGIYPQPRVNNIGINLAF